MAFASAVKNRVVDRRQGGDAGTAWVLSRTETQGTFRGRAIDARGTETMLLRKTAEGWRIVHIHWSSQAVKKP